MRFTSLSKSLLQLCTFSKFTPTPFLSKWRSFANQKKTGVGMGTLYPETEFFHEHVVLTKTLPLSQQVKLSHGLIKFPPPKKDKSAEVFLTRTPSNFNLDEKEAAKRSVNYFFSKSNKKSYVIILDPSKPLDFQSSSSSNVTILFVPFQHETDLSPKQQLQKYVSEKKRKFLERVGHWGVVQQVNLNTSVTSHLANMEFAALRFAGESDDVHGLQHSGKYLFILRTEEGFWETSWKSSLDDLDNNKSVFADIVKSIGVKLPNGKVLKQNLGRDVPSSSSQKKENELDFSSLISKLLGNFHN